MIDRTFAAAYIDNNIRHRIFGRRLKPFSLWHLFLLQVIESPFVSQSEIRLHDLKNAIAICSLNYRNSKIRRPILPVNVTITSLGKYVTRFMEYVGDYLSRPEYTIIPWKVDEPRYVGLPVTDAPNIIVTAFNACASTRLPINEIWDLPIGEAYVAEAMYLRMQGNRLNFTDEDERQFQAEMKAAQQAKKDAA